MTDRSGSGAPRLARHGPVERTIRTALPVDLRLTLGPLARGRADPTIRFGPHGMWRATRTPEGPASTQVTVAAGGRELTMRAWGPGAAWALAAFPALVGAHDDLGGFAPADAVVADLHRRLPGLRIGGTAAVVETLVPTIIEQKVVGLEAKRSYAHLIRALGEPAPGPAGDAAMRVPPHPEVLARTPTWTYHRFGIERKRADTIRIAASCWRRLEECATLPAAEASARLQALPGIGPWTAAEVALYALGDPDAVSVGDYHLPHLVAFALAGEPRADDARMLSLLAPFRGHRGRVIRLVAAGAPKPPRYGPRMPTRQIARI